jgi:lipid-A-disaccharide synthase-like uncharacterized protein
VEAAVNESIPKVVLAIGFTGQVLFSARFIVQWLVSEYRRESTIPMLFWYFSVAGGVTLLAYSILRRDPVFIVGQAAGLVVYLRNLMLIARRKGQDVESRESSVGS